MLAKNVAKNILRIQEGFVCPHGFTEAHQGRILVAEQSCSHHGRSGTERGGGITLDIFQFPSYSGPWDGPTHSPMAGYHSAPPLEMASYAFNILLNSKPRPFDNGDNHCKSKPRSLDNHVKCGTVNVSTLPLRLENAHAHFTVQSTLLHLQTALKSYVLHQF